MLRPVHHTLFMTEVLSWSLTILVLASQQPQQSDMTSSHRFHIWINGSHNAKESRDGTFVSPGFPTTHFSLATTYNFHLTHRSKHGHVKLNFTDFFLMPLDNSAQCGSLLSDYVKIMDGTSVTRHCSHLRPQPYISSSHELTLEYYYTPTTGSFLHHSLLRVGYQFLSRAEAMIEWDNLIRGYYVQETEMSRTGYGQLIASLSPFHHVRTVDYLWYIQAPSNTLIHLNVLDLQIGNRTTLEILDGISSAAEPLARFDGNVSLPEPRSFTSSQSFIYARWNGSVEGWNEGWSRVHVVFTEATLADAEGRCPLGFFSCPFTGICLSERALCDGLPHCQLGGDEDEMHCLQANREGARMLRRRQSAEPIDLSDCHCENGGTCMKDDEPDIDEYRDLGYYCICTEEYSGIKCELMGMAKRHHLAAVIARCTCKNGGTCTPTSSGFGFVCSCSPGFRGYDCSHNDSIPNGSSSPAEYGIAMGAAVVAVLLVMFGVALCICVILQYLRQQRDGPESPYSRTLSRDVYSVEGVDIAGLQMETVEPNDYIPPTYNQCMHPSPSSPEGDIFLTPSPSSQFSVGSRWRLRTPESPPPTYDAILGFCKECSELALRNMAKQQRRGQHTPQLQTPSSDQFDTMSGISSNYTTGPSSAYNTGNNTPSGPMPFSPRALFRGGAAGQGGTSSQSQTESPLEEFELRRVQST